MSFAEEVGSDAWGPSSEWLTRPPALGLQDDADPPASSAALQSARQLRQHHLDRMLHTLCAKEAAAFAVAVELGQALRGWSVGSLWTALETIQAKTRALHRALQLFAHHHFLCSVQRARSAAMNAHEAADLAPPPAPKRGAFDVSAAAVAARRKELAQERDRAAM
jgi:hypothetical protein